MLPTKHTTTSHCFFSAILALTYLLAINLLFGHDGRTPLLLGDFSWAVGSCFSLSRVGIQKRLKTSIIASMTFPVSLFFAPYHAAV